MSMIVLKTMEKLPFLKMTSPALKNGKSQDYNRPIQLQRWLFVTPQTSMYNLHESIHKDEKIMLAHRHQWHQTLDSSKIQTIIYVMTPVTDDWLLYRHEWSATNSPSVICQGNSAFKNAWNQSSNNPNPPFVFLNTQNKVLFLCNVKRHILHLASPCEASPFPCLAWGVWLLCDSPLPEVCGCCATVFCVMWP